jgi:hypothetical protein
MQPRGQLGSSPGTECQAQADSSLVSSRTTHRTISRAAVGRNVLVSAAAYETNFISIALMLWATGLGSEAIRPMAAPVLRGLPAADEVIDFFLSVVYLAVSKKTTGEDSTLETRSRESPGPAAQQRASRSRASVCRITEIAMSCQKSRHRTKLRGKFVRRPGLSMSRRRPSSSENQQE